jgi:3',5'-cyclic AMP phosphodiesterase CpdA
MRIAHLSDLHLLALDGVSPHRFLSKRALGLANLLLHRKNEYRGEVAEAAVRDVNQQGVDHVVVTGDLTNLSLETELVRARELLARLALGAEQVSIIPGNHDVYTHGAERAGRFEEFLGAHLAGDAAAGVGVAGAAARGARGQAAYPYLRLRGPVAIVGLSSAVATAPLWASGRLGQPQLAALAEILRRPEVMQRFVLVLVHHPPVPGVADGTLRRLEDAEAFRGVIRQARVDLVLYGHEHFAHRRSLPTLRGETPCLCAGSTSRVSQRRGKMGRYNIYEVDADGLRAIEARVYDPARGGFFASSEALAQVGGPVPATVAA